MWKIRLLGNVAVASLLTLSGAAFAAPQVVEQSQTVTETNTYDVNAVSLERAIFGIQQNTGGQVMDIRFQSLDGRGVYDAIVSGAGGMSMARMDAQTGHVTALSSNDMPGWMAQWQRGAEVRSFAKATVPLSAAIATAEQAAGGPAIDAGLAKPLSAENDVLAYNIEVVKFGEPRLIAVDANTNEIIANPNSLGLPNRDPAEFAHSVAIYE